MSRRNSTARLGSCAHARSLRLEPSEDRRLLAVAEMLGDLNALSAGMSQVSNVVAAGNRLFFTASDGANGQELWASDGTPASARMVKDILPGSQGSGPRYLTPVGNGVFFAADAAGHYRQLWFSDGTPEGTRFVGQDFGEDIISAFERPLLNTPGQIAFEASMADESGEFARGIWATDRQGELQLVARTGMAWPVAPGDMRTLTLLKLHAGGSSDNGYQQALNDAGLITFSVNFDDGAEAVIVVSTQPGDTDVDGDVDITDLNNVRNNFGGSSAGDTNQDGSVDIVDLNNVRNHFGEGPPTAGVPEPSAGMIALVSILAGIGMMLRRYDSKRFPGKCER